MIDKLLRTLAVAAAIAALFALAACGGGSEPAPATTPSEEPAGAPAGTSQPLGSATVKGTVRYEGDVPRLAAIKMDADPGCAAKHKTPVQSEALVLGDGNTLANVLVQVKSGLPATQFAPPAEPRVMDQEGCRYIPHVMGIMVGQTFKILNSDGLLHNVHSLPKINKGFNRAMPANQTEAEFTFTKTEEPFKIKCDVHPWMNAFVAVLDHPYYSVSGADGSFEIAGLPAGTYELEAWHEKLGTQTATVTIADGETTASDFTFTR